MYDIAVNPLKTQTDLSYEYTVSVTPITHTASDSKGSNRCLLWYFMVQSPSWEAQMSSANKEVPHILWKPAAHYHIHKSPLTLPILSQIDPAYDLITLLENYKIILPSMTRSLKRSLSFGFPPERPFMHLCVKISWQVRRCYWRCCVKFPLGFKWMKEPPTLDSVMNLRPPAH
jgi:hypothetical protein